MQAQQLGIEVSGNNLANVNNPSYARQRLIVQTSPSISSSVGSIGTGVQPVAIARIRQAIYDRQYESEASIASYLETQQKWLGMLGAYLGERINRQDSSAETNNVLSSSGIASAIQNLFDSFNQLTVDPTSLSDRAILLQNAQTLAERFNQLSSDLDSLNSNLNNSINSDINKANDLLQSIADLNKEISQQEFKNGWNANDLRDLRQQKLEELASLVKIDVYEDSDGEFNISINGNLLVSGSNIIDSLETYPDANNNLLIRLKNSTNPIQPGSGSVQGAVDLRDQFLVNLKSNINAVVSQLISEVNSVHSTGFSLNGTTGLDFFTGADAATIKVNAALINNPELIQLSDSPDAPASNKIALSLSQIAVKKLSALNNSTINEAYNRIVESAGLELAKVNQRLDEQNVIKDLIQRKRSSISGVSIDEEMTELIKYQRAFEASAKLITVVDELFDSVLSMKQ